LLLTLVGWSGRPFGVALAHHSVQHESDNKAQQYADDGEKKVVSVQSKLLLSVLEHPANFLAKFRAIRMTMMGTRMIHRGLQYFVFRSFQFQSATTFAGVIATVDTFSLCISHDVFLRLKIVRGVYRDSRVRATNSRSLLVS
jgi:hypothetical protein